MATAMLKSTYSLDLQTATTLDRLAQLWKTSKSDVIRRLAKDASAKLDHISVEPTEKPIYTPDNPINEDAARRIAALRKLQKSFADQNVDFEQWKQDIWESRR